MASEIRVDKITSLSGVGTISPSPTGVEIAGITTVATLKATTGIVTTLTATGSAKVGSGITLSPDGDIFATGITTITNAGSYNGNLIVDGSLQFFTDSATLGIVSRRSGGGGNFLVNDPSSSSRLRTVDGRLHISADENNEADDSEIRFLGDSNIRAQISAGSSFMLANDTDTFIGHPANNELSVTTNGSERVRINSIGTLLKGHTTASTNIHDAQTTTNREILLQIHGGNSIHAAAALIAWNDSHSPFYSSALYLATSGSDTIGTNAVVTSDHTLGSIIFSGDDGDEFVKGAKIEAHVDGTPGSDDMPTRLMFFTNSGSDQPTERMRIHGSGVASFTSGIELGSGVDATAANTLDDYEEGTFTPTTGEGTFTNAEGKYTKIGNQVTVWIYIPTLSDTTSTSNFTIQSLPFSGAANMVQSTGSVMIRYVNSTAKDGVNFSTYQDAGWSYLRIYASRDDANNYEALKHSDFSQTSPGLRVCHTYQTA